MSKNLKCNRLTPLGLKGLSHTQSISYCSQRKYLTCAQELTNSQLSLRHSVKN